MQLRSRLIPMIAAGALIAAACANEEALTSDPDDGVAEVDEDVADEEAPEEAPEEDVADEEAPEDDAADATEDTDVDDDAAAEDDMAAEGVAEPAGVTTTGIEVADADLGAHIVTAEGMTTYGAIDQLDGEVTCVGDCAQVWQPVLVDGEPEVADDVDAEVTTIEREDGGVQVVVAGSPLHTFVVDAEAGDVRGQASAERWFVVSATGELVDAPDPGALDDDTDEDE